LLASVKLLIVTAGFLAFLALTQILVRRSMDDGQSD